MSLTGTGNDALEHEYQQLTALYTNLTTDVAQLEAHLLQLQQSVSTQLEQQATEQQAQIRTLMELRLQQLVSWGCRVLVRLMQLQAILTQSASPDVAAGTLPAGTAPAVKQLVVKAPTDLPLQANLLPSGSVRSPCDIRRPKRQSVAECERRWRLQRDIDERANAGLLPKRRLCQSPGCHGKVKGHAGPHCADTSHDWIRSRRASKVVPGDELLVMMNVLTPAAPLFTLDALAKMYDVDVSDCFDSAPPDDAAPLAQMCSTIADEDAPYVRAVTRALDKLVEFDKDYMLLPLMTADAGCGLGAIDLARGDWRNEARHCEAMARAKRARHTGPPQRSPSASTDASTHSELPPVDPPCLLQSAASPTAETAAPLAVA